MDNKLKQYQDAIIALLEAYTKSKLRNMPDVENQTLIDKENHHYLFQRVGWSKGKFSHACLFHFDIKEDKIWLQCNWTDSDLAEELVNLGVKKEDIVLGFIPASERKYTDYAA
ncbi:MAG: XisI protein [Bacteroidota bacterium]